jgi:DNA-directed RNA polymerase I, II, and III subunit RPABC2
MEDIRFSSRIVHPEVQPVARDSVDTSDRITLPYYSKYEYTTLVGIRAQQIADGAKPLISLEGIQTSHPQFVWKVAEREIAERVLPFIVHRRLPDGKSEYWSTTELTVVW